MNLQDKIAAIKAECEERLPELEPYGGEARARRGVLAMIERHEWAFGAGHPLWANVGVALESLQAICDAWETP